MIVACPACQSRYRFDEAKLGGRPRVSLRCSKCGGAIEIENPLLASTTLPPSEPLAAPAAKTSPQHPPSSQPHPPSAPQPPPSTREREDLHTRETPIQPREPGTATLAGVEAQRAGMLHLPKDKRYSLAVIQGAATGSIFPIQKTRMIIGRSGADINLDDPEASRQHAALEIVGEIAVLRDLGSTNGTWIELERVEQQQLGNQQEFRIGSHVLMFIVTEVE